MIAAVLLLILLLGGFMALCFFQFVAVAVDLNGNEKGACLVSTST